MGRDMVLGGRYELAEKLGQGGMGTVHRGVDQRLRRTVAVKVLSSALAHDPQSRARFRREAHAAAALNHPAVATIHDVGEEPHPDGPRPYLVMEYVQGATLAEVLRGGPLSVVDAVNAACAVLDALRHSHECGIVHRDIKPSNIMVTGPETVKVLDFGIAKAFTETATRITGSGAAIGTPAYLSPEQINGAEIDHRADLYAMGCLLHELLTGQTPFRGESPFAIMHQHLFATPEPVSRLRAQIPPAVDAVILRALSKDPKERFDDAAQMRAALAGALAQASLPTVQATASGPPVTRTGGRTALRDKFRISLRPCADSALALLGCLLSLLCARGQLVDTAHFGRVAIAAGVLGLVTLPWSTRLSCAVGWGPVAEAVAVNSELRRAYIGWQHSYVAIAALLALAAACCLVSAARGQRRGAGSWVAFWFSATASIWYVLDDLHKLFVFYLLLSLVAIATVSWETFELVRRRAGTGRQPGKGRSPA
ncbi:serine/threonine-protein kinase [Streptomyces griseochromogenes]|uniref:non-specific serine/threonine protein kinase n=2 Tax=Streptomyces griseochromogenes TaxID=68214 RepID=A0ABS4M8C2_9ACTN|nr:protein kinase [Streptomyces griseochromogenes]MBP2055667.1 serine/threonine-protein kinase [Streptomyces griseochromogenes]